jgi:hypothetical protein
MTRIPGVEGNRASPVRTWPCHNGWQDRQSLSLADVILDALINTEAPVLDELQDVREVSFPATQYVIREFELGLQSFLQTEAGLHLLRSAANGAILHQRFNLPVRKDARKKSFAQFIRARLEEVLNRCRKDAGLTPRGAAIFAA